MREERGKGSRRNHRVPKVRCSWLSLEREIMPWSHTALFGTVNPKMIAYFLLISIWIRLPIISLVPPFGYRRCSIEMCKSTPELGSRAAVAAVGPSHGNQGNDCRANEKIGAGRAVHDYRWWRD